MNCATAITIGISLGLGMGLVAPSVTRPTSSRIVVEGVEYAGIVPEAQVVEGVPLLSGYAYADDRVVFEVDPAVVYTVHAFEALADGETDRAYSAVEISSGRENMIDEVVLNRILSERAFDEMMLGTHPDFDEAVDFFELGQSVIRVRSLTQ